MDVFEVKCLPMTDLVHDIIDVEAEFTRLAKKLCAEFLLQPLFARPGPGQVFEGEGRDPARRMVPFCHSRLSRGWLRHRQAAEPQKAA